MPRTVHCRRCGGTAIAPDDQAGRPSGRPYGWYLLSVNVPPELGKNGQPFLWVGMWCGTGCLAADMPSIIEQEMLARMAYEPDLPVLPGPRRSRP
jgi:hypothetical protein